MEGSEGEREDSRDRMNERECHLKLCYTSPQDKGLSQVIAGNWEPNIDLQVDLEGTQPLESSNDDS